MLKQKLINRELTLGTWITIGNPAVAEIMATAGFDWVVIDLEHSTISVEQAGELIRIVDLLNVTPLVRLTSNDPDQVKKFMDAGAKGIIVPMVNNQEDALKSVSSTRYAPIGTRGVGLGRAQGYGTNFEKYFSSQTDQNNGPVVIVQIEHKDAIPQLENILNVPGIDAFFIGPYDLSCSLGIAGKFKHPKFIKAINQIMKIAKKLNKICGIHIVEPDLEELEDKIKMGYKFIAYSVDFRMLDVTARNGIKSVKKFKI